MRQRRQEAAALLLSAVVHGCILGLPASNLQLAEQVEQPLAVSLSLERPPEDGGGLPQSGAGQPARAGSDKPQEGHRPAAPLTEPEDPPPEDRAPEAGPAPLPERIAGSDVERAATRADPTAAEPPATEPGGRVDSDSPARAAGEGESAAGVEGAAQASSGGAAGRAATAGKAHAKGRGTQREAEMSEVLPALLYAPKPPYPSRSRDLGEEGTVILAILVGEDGRVRQCQVASTSGYPLLDGSALSAVRRKWRFKAGTSAGKSVPRWVRVPVEFSITRR